MVGEKVVDKDILQLLVDKNSNGLEHAISKYGGLVRTVVHNMIGNKADVDELISDTFLKLWKNCGNIDLERCSIKGYLCMAARSSAIDRLRQLKRFEALPVEDNDIGIDVNFEDEYAKKVNCEVIAKCIKSLPSPDREIFINRFYFRKSVKEIAQMLDITEKKVENVLYRSKKKLKKSLIEGGIIL